MKIVSEQNKNCTRLFCQPIQNEPQRITPTNNCFKIKRFIRASFFKQRPTKAFLNFIKCIRTM